MAAPSRPAISGPAMRRSSTSCGTFSDTGSTTSTAAPRLTSMPSRTPASRARPSTTTASCTRARRRPGTCATGTCSTRCRTAFRDDAVLIGFSTNRGTVAAASYWDEPMEVKQVRPSRPDSHERVFLETGIACSLTDIRGGDRELREVLSEPRLERAIGVVYRPETERYSHYFEAVLAEQFDALVWFEDTRAVTPMPAGHAAGVPETYPFGV